MKNFARAFLFIASIVLLLIAGCNNQDITPPAAIDANSVNVTVGDGSVQLSWTNSSDNDFYGTRISFTPAAANVTQPITIQGDRGSVSSTTISGLSNNTEYTFSLVALDKSLNVSLATIKRATPTASNNSSSSTEETSTSGGSTTGETTGSGGSTGGNTGGNSGNGGSSGGNTGGNSDSGGNTGGGSSSTTTPTGYPATVVAAYSITQSGQTQTITFYSNNTFTVSEPSLGVISIGTYTGNIVPNGTVTITGTQQADYNSNSGSFEGFSPIPSQYATIPCTVSANGNTLTVSPENSPQEFTRDNISTATPTVVAEFNMTPMASAGYPQLVDKYVFYSNGTWIERYDGTGPEYGSNGPVQGSSSSYDLVGRAGVYTGNAATDGSVTLITILIADEPSSTATSYTNTNCPLQAYTGSGAQSTATISGNEITFTNGNSDSGNGGSSGGNGSGTNSGNVVFSGVYSQGNSNCTIIMTFSNNGTWTYRLNGIYYGKQADFIFCQGTYTGNTTQDGNLTLVVTHTAQMDESTLSTATSLTNTNCPLTPVTSNMPPITATVSNNQLSASNSDFLPITLTR